MGLTKAGRNLAKAPFLELLKQFWLRRRLIFELKQRYYEDLQIVVPLEPGLSCPVVAPQYWDSFAEIFIERTYSAAFDKMPLPSRWIDLGCHAGYFSLFVIWQRNKQALLPQCRSLLIDADPRVKLAVDRLTELNNLTGQLYFQPGAIAAGDGISTFVLRASMSSAVAKDTAKGEPTVAVPILSPSEIMRLLPPPYDLIKVDIEGAEFAFLTGYEEVMQKSKYLLIEWHSWHDGGGSREQICQLASAKGFRLIFEPVVSHAVNVNGNAQSCGTILFGAEGAP